MVFRRPLWYFVRLADFVFDFKNFYNDPTHIKPYTPHSLKYTLTLFGMEVVFLEPGLICKSYFWWRLPDIIKWNVHVAQLDRAFPSEGKGRWFDPTREHHL